MKSHAGINSDAGIDIRQCHELRTLYCQNTSLSTLDLSGCVNISYYPGYACFQSSMVLVSDEKFMPSFDFSTFMFYFCSYYIKHVT